MIKLKNKKLVVLPLSLIICFFIYLKFFKSEEINQVTKEEIKEENFTNSNIIKDIKYSSKDLKGNEYIILAKQGEIDLNNNDVIFLKEVNAYIKMIKNNETIEIESDYGKYNTLNYDTIFSKNVQIRYLDNKIIGEYLDFSMAKNKLIISKNVVYTNSENVLKSDVVELDTTTQNTKIFMYNSEKKVNIESLN
tara:strand:- start:282 stop:860 length:579 start_codon:yes stop_codon:yes gene_type:complete